MIKNEREYRITKSQVANFKKSLSAIKAEDLKTQNDVLAAQLQDAALRSQLEEMEDELKQYEDLIERKPKVIAANSIEEPPKALDTDPMNPKRT